MMVEEGIHVPETPEISCEDEKRRASRNSTGSSIPRYLRPSTRSCHDFCKYGKKKETESQPETSVLLHRRRMMKLSGRHSLEKSPSTEFRKAEPKAKTMIAAKVKQKANSYRKPKSMMQSVSASSSDALKPKSSRTPPRGLAENHALPPKVKPVVTKEAVRKSSSSSIDSATTSKIQKKKKEAEFEGNNKEEVQGKEWHSNDVKFENEASESTDYHSMIGFSKAHENGRSHKSSDFSESDEADDTKGEDKAEMIRSADIGRAGKLKFKRGKVDDLQSELHSPRRLKFRSGRALDKDSGYQSDPGSMKVALKHTQQQEKKVAMCLLNDMIEDTALKLIRMEKSKVKALVGAFETVISLQDVNASANIVE